MKSWAGAVAVVAAFAMLVGLGTWQIQRRAWKHALIAHIQARIHAPAVAMPAHVNDPKLFDYRHMRATGRFLNDREIHLASQVRDGIAGVDVITPLVRTGGETVLVNRGWVPTALADPAKRPAGQLTGVVTVTGIARIPPGRGYFMPPNEPARGFWSTVDIPAIRRFLKLGPTLPVVLEADAVPGNPGGWPKGGVTRITLRDEHLQYAITWYSLALALVVIVLVARRRRTRPDSGSRS